MLLFSLALFLVCQLVVNVCLVAQWRLRMTIHRSVPHMRANTVLEALYQLQIPAVGVSLLTVLLQWRLDGMNGLRLATILLVMLSTAGVWLRPAIPCSQCSTGFWKRVFTSLIDQRPATSPG